jgi:hypothetical protein
MVRIAGAKEYMWHDQNIKTGVKYFQIKFNKILKMLCRTVALRKNRHLIWRHDTQPNDT